jgi:ligand-binding sensor domain-containing protein
MNKSGEMYTKQIIIQFLLFFFLVFLLPTKSIANERLFFEHITTEDGLSNGSVFKTFRDSKGFIWVCTEDGLNKYNGYSFKKYNSIIDNKVSTNSIQIMDIIEDQYFNLWLGTSEGLFIYNRKKDNFTQIESNSSNGDNYGILNGLINCLLFDNDNRLWVGTYMGLCRIDKLEQNTNFQSISNFHFYYKLDSNPKGISDNRIFSIRQGKDNEIWLTSASNNIDHFIPQNDNFEHIEIQFNKRIYPSLLIKKISLDNAGGAWIYTTGSGLIYWTIKTNEFEQITIKDKKGDPLNTSIVQSIMIDKNEDIWIGTDGNGIIKINKNKELIGHYKKDENYFSNLSSNAIYSIYEDQLGTLWVLTS